MPSPTARGPRLPLQLAPRICWSQPWVWGGIETEGCVSQARSLLSCTPPADRWAMFAFKGVFPRRQAAAVGLALMQPASPMELPDALGELKDAAAAAAAARVADFAARANGATPQRPAQQQQQQQQQQEQQQQQTQEPELASPKRCDTVRTKPLRVGGIRGRYAGGVLTRSSDH